MAFSKLEARGHLLHKKGTPPKQISRECIESLFLSKRLKKLVADGTARSCSQPKI